MGRPSEPPPPRSFRPRLQSGVRAGAAVAAAFVALVSLPLPAGGAAPGPPDAPAAGERVTFGVTPSSVSGPDGRAELAYAVSPGEVLYDHVAALNYSSQPLTLQLYASDAVETTQGGFGLALAAARRAGVGSWISIPPQYATITVPVRSALGPGTVVVPITVDVPSSATPGDHAGGILVSLSTTGRNSSGEEITLNQRTGTRVLMTVSGTVAPELTVTGIHASYSGTADPVGRGTVHLSYTVHNAGNVDLGVALDASASGLLGASAHTRLPGVAFLLPGASVSGTAQVPGVWPQILSHASVTASPRTVANGKSVALAPVSASTSVWTVPWLLVIIVIVAIAAVLLYRRQRKRRPPAQPVKGPRHARGSSSRPKVEVPA